MILSRLPSFNITRIMDMCVSFVIYVQVGRFLSLFSSPSQLNFTFSSTSWYFGNPG